MKKYILATLLSLSCSLTSSYALLGSIHPAYNPSQGKQINNFCYTPHVAVKGSADEREENLKLQYFLEGQGLLLNDAGGGWAGNYTPGVYDAKTAQAVKGFLQKKYVGVVEGDIDTTLVPSLSDRQQLVRDDFVINTSDTGMYTRAKIAYVSCHGENSAIFEVKKKILGNNINNPPGSVSSLNAVDLKVYTITPESICLSLPFGVMNSSPCGGDRLFKFPGYKITMNITKTDDEGEFVVGRVSYLASLDGSSLQIPDISYRSDICSSGSYIPEGAYQINNGSLCIPMTKICPPSTPTGFIIESHKDCSSSIKNKIPILTSQQDAVVFGVYEGINEYNYTDHRELLVYLEIPMSVEGKILVLTSRDPVKWMLRNPNNIKPSKIIVSGMGISRVLMDDSTAVPASVERYAYTDSVYKLKQSYDYGVWADSTSTMTTMYPQFPVLKNWLQSKKINMISFTGVHSARNNPIFLKPGFANTAPYEVYLNGASTPTIKKDNMTRANSDIDCKAQHTANPNSSIHCIWGGVEIYSFAPQTITQNTEVVQPTTQEQNQTSNNINVSVVTLVSPNGGESYKIGDILPITWISTGSSSVHLNLIIDRDNNGTYETVWGLANSAPQPASGSYSWIIPNTIFGSSIVGVKNKISVNSSEGTDISDTDFNVVTATQNENTPVITDTDVNETLQNPPCVTISHDISYRLRNSYLQKVLYKKDVTNLQYFLNSAISPTTGKVYLSAEPTGYFGKATKEAVITFQKDNSLITNPPLSGYVGPGTRNRIHSLGCGTVASTVNTTNQTQTVSNPYFGTSNSQTNPLNPYSKPMNQFKPAGTVKGVSTFCVNLSRNLHRGAESTQVSDTQSFLYEKGFLTEEPSGFYGDKTVEAVKDYQASKGLPVTGMVYDFTRQSIKEETCQ